MWLVETKTVWSGMDRKEAGRTGPGNGLLRGRGIAGMSEGSRSKAVIAAVNEAAVAGGFEIALACDIIVAADHAVFGLPEVKRGMFAFAGGVQRLARLVPRPTAMTVIMTGVPLPAAGRHELCVISTL